MTIPIVGQPPRNGFDADRTGHGWPLLRLGFRPFYLGAALFGALAVPLWLVMRSGALAPAGPVPALAWHAHEMLFGFAAAVIVGFLFTAGRAWTGQDTPRGPALGALALLWLAARVAPFVAPPAVWAALDLVLLPAAAGVLARVLWKARNGRNAPLVALLLALAACNAAFHFGSDWLAPLHGALAVIVAIECVIAGRIVPAFTMGATPGLKLAVPAWLPKATLATTLAALAAWALLPVPALAAGLLAAAAALQVALALRWRPQATLQRPILWILHAAYAFIPLGLALLAAAQAGWLPASPGVHALAVGASGGLIIGMLTRTARGHTGRPLRASRLEVTAYGLVLAAAALRSVLAPLVDPALALPLAGAAWSIAFALYAWRFGPWLCAPRADGKDG